MFRVVIAGRPNVGKSTLFNRLIGRRRAITERTPGVTRDPVSAGLELGGQTVTLTDTGGYRASEIAVEKQVAERALGAVREADVVLFMLEYQAVTPEDELLLEQLNRFRDKVLLVVNKVDTADRELGLYEFFRFGFEPVLGISAEHNRGVDELREVLAARLGEIAAETARTGAGAEKAEPEAAASITLAILGQPNTGKSTLANALLDRESSLVDAAPGTTRDVIEAEFAFGSHRFRLLDTAGMRRRSRVNEPLEYYSVNRAVASLSEADVVLLVIDAQKGVTEQDKKIAGLIVKRGCGVVLVLNKWDLTSGRANEYRAVCDRVRFVFPVLQFAPIVAVSAREHTGIRRMLETVLQVHDELGKRIDTARLNRSFRCWVEENPPPVINGRRPRLFYVTQTDIRPVVFVIFAGRKKDLPASYLTYIRNRIREEFEFRSVPIRVEIRERSRS